jgi:hypothetical protein
MSMSFLLLLLPQPLLHVPFQTLWHVPLLLLLLCCPLLQVPF